MRWLLAVCGVGATITSPQIVLNLRKMGFTVRVILSPNACKFVSPEALEVISGCKVFHSTFDRGDGVVVPHIELAEECDIVVVFPASASMVARLAYGLADELVSATVLHTHRPVVVVPALNATALNKPVVERNLLQLERDGYHVLRPVKGKSVRITDLRDVGVSIASLESVVALVRRLGGKASQKSLSKLGQK